MSNLRFFKHMQQITEEPVASEFLDEIPSQYQYGSSFSYYESIHEFNQVQYVQQQCPKVIEYSR